MSTIKDIMKDSYQEGRAEMANEFARRALKRGLTVKEIQEITDLSVEEIEAIKKGM